MRPPVPRAAEWLLTHLVQADAADVIAGDLREEFQLVVEARGRGWAHFWYWRQVVVAIVLCRLRLRRTSNGGADAQRRARLMARLLPDLRFAVRTLLKRPAFTVGAAGALALGIGLTTAVFSVTDAVLLRPLPFVGVNRLVTLQQTNPDNPEDVRISPATYLDWRDASHAFAAMAAVRPWSFTFAATDDPVIWPAGLVSEGFFELLGVRPMLGRTFVPEDYRPGAERVVVVSHQLWRRQFGADPSIVGRPLRFDDVGAMTIVGVMGPDFRWLDRTQLLWGPYPMAESLRQQRAATFVRAIARVRETAGLDNARAEATVLRGELAKQHPRLYRAIDLQVMPITETLLGRVRKPILLLFAAVALVALIACANVGTLAGGARGGKAPRVWYPDGNWGRSAASGVSAPGGNGDARRGRHGRRSPDRGRNPAMGSRRDTSCSSSPRGCRGQLEGVRVLGSGRCTHDRAGQRDPGSCICVDRIRLALYARRAAVVQGARGSAKRLLLPRSR